MQTSLDRYVKGRSEIDGALHDGCGSWGKQHTAIDRLWNDAIQYITLNGSNPMRSIFCQMRTYLIAGVFLLAACFGTQLFAQSAAVSGQVADASGAAVKGATITLLRPSTDVKTITVSDASGSFILPPVAPGHYELTVTADGFTPWKDTGIVLEIGQHKAVNAVLLIGSVNQTVTVTDAPAELQTENADRSTLLESSFVANLPLNIRNPLQLITATVGVTQNDTGTGGTNVTTQSTTNQFRINGSKQATTDMLIDGGANMVAYNSQAAGIPGVDATGEFRVLTTAYAPEYGYTSGGIVNYSIKSGTNKIHGGGWEYFRNDLLTANGYNANNAHIQRPPLTMNQFGGQFGGPIVLPKLYNGHDKTFFFFSYEGLRETYEPAGGFSAFVPTDAMIGRNGLPGGDFSAATNSVNYPMAGITVYDPANVVSGKRVQFPNNIIPASRIDPVAQKLLSMFPSPTPGYFAASNGAANYFNPATETDTSNAFDLRIDHQFSQKHTVFGHFDRFSNYIKNPDDYGPTGLGHEQEPTNSDDRIPGYHILVNHAWSIRNDLIFNHHGSWGHSESNRASVLPLSPSKTFGFSPTASPGYTDTFTPQIFNVPGQIGTPSGTITTPAIGNAEPLETNKSSVYQYQADLSWLKGKHVFKLGTDNRHYFVQHWDPQGLTLAGGKAITGGPNPTATNTNGSAIAELLLGFTPVVSGYQPLVTIRDQVYFVYGEDTYKITSKLTATYGLRYGAINSWKSDGNILNYLDLTSPSPIAAATGLSLVGGVGIPGVSTSSRNLQQAGLLHFEPRLGVSYALNDKTVIHGGFGIFRHPQASEASYSELGGSARVSTSVSNQSVGGNYLIVPGSSTTSTGCGTSTGACYTLANPFFSSPSQAPPAPYGDNPTPLAGNNVGSGPLSINLGQNVSGDLRQQTGPYQEITSVDVQRELPGHFVVTAGYILNQGVRLRSAVALNQLSDSVLAQCVTGATVAGKAVAGDPSGKTCPALTTNVTNPFYKVITDASAVNNLAAATIPNGNLLRAYPQFGKFNALDVGWGHSTYNALQMTLQHRQANGFSLLMGYTYSKAVDQTGEGSTGTTIQDNGCHSCENSNSEQDAPHVFTENTIYELPFGHGRKYFTSGPPAYLAGGWQLGTAYRFSTGIPTIFTQTATSLIGNSVLRPSINSGVSLKPTASTQAFNPLAFSATPAYMFGTAPRYNADVRYPNYQNLDVFVQKTTTFWGERLGATIRFEALNATNSVVFGPPTVNVNSSSFGNKSTSQTNNPRVAQISGRFTF